MRVLVTGGTGFVGRNTMPVLRAAGHDVAALTRQETGEIGPDTDWQPHLEGIEIVVHLAARAHVMRDPAPDPLAAFRKVNTAGTARLLEAAQATGVRRLVFLSTVKVNGERSERPFTARDRPAPEDSYGLSKWEAEQALQSHRGGVEVVVLRPPLVYGPGVKGNFLRLMRWIDRRIPLPFGAVRNRRSLIGVGNLAGAILWSLDGPPGTYLPSDGEDLSTPELIRRVATALDRPARIFPLPAPLLALSGAVAGQADAIARLTGSLVVDNDLPGWQPPYSPDLELASAADWFRRAESGRT